MDLQAQLKSKNQELRKLKLSQAPKLNDIMNARTAMGSDAVALKKLKLKQTQALNDIMNARTTITDAIANLERQIAELKAPAPAPALTKPTIPTGCEPETYKDVKAITSANDALTGRLTTLQSNPDKATAEQLNRENDALYVEAVKVLIKELHGISKSDFDKLPSDKRDILKKVSGNKDIALSNDILTCVNDQLNALSFAGGYQKSFIEELFGW